MDSTATRDAFLNDIDDNTVNLIYYVGFGCAILLCTCCVAWASGMFKPDKRKKKRDAKRKKEAEEAAKRREAPVDAKYVRKGSILATAHSQPANWTSNPVVSNWASGSTRKSWDPAPRPEAVEKGLYEDGTYEDGYEIPVAGPPPIPPAGPRSGHDYEYVDNLMAASYAKHPPPTNRAYLEPTTETVFYDAYDLPTSPATPAP